MAATSDLTVNVKMVVDREELDAAIAAIRKARADLLDVIKLAATQAEQTRAASSAAASS